MSENDSKHEVVAAGHAVTVETQVGAGRARVDVQPGQPLPADVSDAEREQLRARGALVAADSDGRDDEHPVGEAEFTAPDGAPVVRPVPGVVEPDEIPADVIPGGSMEQIMAWVGDDLARARVALDMELNKGMGARAELVDRLNAVKAEAEQEPHEVPEALDENLGAVGGKAEAPESGGDVQAEEPAKPSRSRKSTSK